MDETQIVPPPAVPDASAGFRIPPLWLLTVWLAIALAAWPAVQRVAARRNEIPPDDLILSAKLIQDQQYPEAIAAAQRYLRRKSGSADALINIGMAYANMGKWDDAIQTTQNALLIRPDYQLAWSNLRWMLASRSASHPTAEAYQAQALELYRAGNYRACADEAGRALKLFPQYTKAFNLLSVCYLNLGMYDDAIANAQAALRIEPHFELARNNLNFAMQRKAQGLTPPPASPSVTPATADVWLTSSLQNYRAGRMQACVDDARAALKLQSNLAVAYNNIAACSNELGRPDDAIAAAAEALRLQPDFQLARNNMAVALKLKAAAARLGK